MWKWLLVWAWGATAFATLEEREYKHLGADLLRLPCSEGTCDFDSRRVVPFSDFVRQLQKDIDEALSDHPFDGKLKAEWELAQKLETFFSGAIHFPEPKILADDPVRTAFIERFDPIFKKLLRGNLGIDGGLFTSETGVNANAKESFPLPSIKFPYLKRRLQLLEKNFFDKEIAVDYELEPSYLSRVEYLPTTDRWYWTGNETILPARRANIVLMGPNLSTLKEIRFDGGNIKIELKRLADNGAPVTHFDTQDRSFAISDITQDAEGRFFSRLKGIEEFHVGSTKAFSFSVEYRFLSTEEMVEKKKKYLKFQIGQLQKLVDDLK